MRKLIFSVVLIGVSAISYGQRDKEYVIITRKLDAPKRLKILALDIPIWHLSGSMVNSSLYNVKPSLSYVGAGAINGGVTYNWQVGDRLFPSTYERTDYVYNNMVMSKYNAPAAQSFNAWMAFFFQDEMTQITADIRLEKVGRTVYYTTVKTDAYKRTGIEVGYSQGYSWYNMNKMKVIGEDLGTGGSRSFDFDSKSTVQTFKTIKLGLILTKAVNVKVEVDGYGIRRSGYLNQHSFNIMFAVQNKFDDVLVGTPNTYTNEMEFAEYKFSDENKRLPFGIEYRYKHYSKGWVSYEVGAGYYPGLLKGINLGVFGGISVQIDMLMKDKL